MQKTLYALMFDFCYFCFFNLLSMSVLCGGVLLL